LRTPSISSSLRSRRRAAAPTALWSRLRPLLLSPGGGVFLICATFVAISAWWLANDVRMVNVDNAKHLLIAARWENSLRGGELLAPFTEWAQYPPGVHLVGAVAILVGGVSVPGMVIAENLVFVPLLALGCYGTARIAFGRTAGLLAVLFAFAVPMVMSMFHVFMLDGPETAMVALTAWLLLASERFARVEVAAAAGIVAGLGMYTKGTFALFVAGLALMLFLRGGWRNWKGWLAFGVLFAAVCGAWYIGHLDDLRGQTSGAIGTAAGPATPLWYGSVHFPEPGTFANFAWYGWNLVNHQLYLPLTLFFAAGLAWAVWQVAVRRRWRDSYVPELLAGGLVGYVGVSMIVLKDPRYSLPCLVFIAVLATGWIVTLPRRPQLVAVALLVTVFVLNTVTHNFGVGGYHEIATPWKVSSPLGEYSFKVVNQAGYFEGAPSRRAEPFVDLLDRIHERGGRAVALDGPAFSSGGWHLGGTTLLVIGRTKLGLSFDPAAVRSRADFWVARLPVEAVGRPPCIRSPLADDGSGLYVYRGRVPENPRRTVPDCP
jgi:hypothetical protein